MSTPDTDSGPTPLPQGIERVRGVACGVQGCMIGAVVVFVLILIAALVLLNLRLSGAT